MAGLRVLRGPDWIHGNQDGGEGHTGTVVSIDNKMAEVIWDNGSRTSCRTGKDGKHDVLVFDNATIGVRHTKVTCNSCGEHGIRGMRWKCVTCTDYDLCSVCYVRGEHQLSHEFIRYTTPGSEGVKVGKRSTCQRIQANGIFPGATVERGPDWKWEDQDGGRGSRGKVVSVENSSGDSAARNVVRVRWENGGSDIYRVGANGKMDLKFVEEFPGTYYYKDHLPRVQEGTKVDNLTETETEVLKDGDMVFIKLSTEVLKEKQKEGAGWSSGMADCIGKTGVIKSFSPTGNILVEFDGQRFSFFPGALQKIPKLSKDDIVKIISDEDTVKVMQQSCGGWVNNMRQVLGKFGKVVKTQPDRGVTVSFGEVKWVFNPACCTPAPGEHMDVITPTKTSGGSGSSSSSSDDGSLKALFGVQSHLLQMLAKLTTERDELTGPKANSNTLYVAIVKGDEDVAKSIVRRQPSLVNERFNGVTPLIIASLEGEMEIVKMLLENNADKEASDSNGSTSLFAALSGKKEDVAKLLIEQGSKINVSNKGGRTPLHFAAFANLPNATEFLIQRGCQVNVQDTNKDTALHDAIYKGNKETVAVLCRASEQDLTIHNKKGFNPLQWAALRDNIVAVEMIIQRDKSTVNSKKSTDLFSALDIATVNHHNEIIKLLIEQGSASVNAKSENGFTALHLACHEGYYDTVVLLVEKGSSLDIQEDKGDTPLHTAVSGSPDTISHLARLLGNRDSSDDAEVRVRIACFLMEKGASHTVTNRNGKTPLETAKNDKIRRGVSLYIESKRATSATATTSSSSDGVLGNVPLPCCKCVETMSDITLKPCEHMILCSNCCMKVDRCPICEKFIEKRITASNEELEKP